MSLIQESLSLPLFVPGTFPGTTSLASRGGSVVTFHVCPSCKCAYGCFCVKNYYSSKHICK